MKKINIWNKEKKIGYFCFDNKNRTIDVYFEEGEEEKYKGVFKIIVERIRKRGFSSLIFDEKTNRIVNVDNNVLLAMKQECFINLGLVYLSC
jgi:Fe-S-cluster containining protein